MNCAAVVLGAVLLSTTSVAVSQVTPAGPSGSFSTGSAYVQAPAGGLGPSVAPALEVQPGPPLVPLGEPLPRRPIPAQDARQPLPGYESAADGANLRVGPSVGPPRGGDRETSTGKAGGAGEGQP